MAVADFYAAIHEAAAAPRHRRAHLDDAERDRERRGVRPGPRARAIRPHIRRALRPGADRSARVMTRFARAHRQGESGAFLLGQLRPRGHALFRPHRAAAKGITPNVARLGDGGSLLARGFQLRLLAGQWRLRPRRLYVYAYPEPVGYGETTLRTTRRFYDETSASSSCPIMRCARLATPMGGCWDFCRRPTRPRRPLDGIARRWKEQSSRKLSGRESTEALAA